MLNGNTLRDAIISGANNISNCKVRVDELNVFPVPDGDTGTNMSMSIGNAARELARLEGETVSKVADVAASALLRGARGNSGVITSLLFRGFAKGFKDAEFITSENLAAALKFGVEAAYKAVMKPTEGTILTVARVASEYAEKAYEDGKEPIEVFEAAMEGAEYALSQTPELLPVLKKAGVVDAGGKGFCVILDGMYSVLKNGVMIESEASSGEVKAESEERNVAGEFDGEITFTYCTEFIVNRNSEVDKAPAELRAELEKIGDCVVVVDDDEIIKVHVHTDHPGNAIENGLLFGSLVNLKIENMRDQHERAKHDSGTKKPAQNSTRTETYTPVAPEKPVGFVSVCAGSGIEALFTDLGVDSLVSGGQTMNPSTDDILRAIELTPAETVFVLPNNKNIIMAAEQAIPISTRKVIVLHTRTIPEGISAMLAFDPDSSDEDNAINMRDAYSRVGTGQITFAARDSDYEGHKIKKGELLALANGKVSFVETDMSRCIQKLIKQLLNRDSSFVTVIYGEDVTDERAAEIEEELNAKFAGKVEFTFIKGMQPIYYFIISVE
ncbi:MAG: DAK2 domain-containing protein [Clostridia bacterium]|nr:DAK2 domain-containing protein [Clostridia bacterium]MBQ5798823.1 DAK2 domain-containing protein [Clostridia bacterium]MEE1279093.1 DAK2 domain-containing protein [Acutalibacteraceae bacterium]